MHHYFMYLVFFFFTSNSSPKILFLDLYILDAFAFWLFLKHVHHVQVSRFVHQQLYLPHFSYKVSSSLDSTLNACLFFINLHAKVEILQGKKLLCSPLYSCNQKQNLLKIKYTIHIFKKCSM